MNNDLKSSAMNKHNEYTYDDQDQRFEQWHTHLLPYHKQLGFPWRSSAYACTHQEMRQADHYTIQQLAIDSMVLMEQAGLALVQRVLFHKKRIEHHMKQPLNWVPQSSDYFYTRSSSHDALGKPMQRNSYEMSIAIVCGKGNNAGDALVLTRHLITQNIPVHLYLAYTASHCSSDWQKQWHSLQQLQNNHPELPLTIHDELDTNHQADLWIDALCGTGVQGKLRGKIALWVEHLNQIKSKQRCWIIAVDVPSGLHDSSQFGDTVVQADETVALAAYGTALWSYFGRSCAGKLYCADIGIPHQAFKQHQGHLWPPCQVMHPQVIQWAQRIPLLHTHKGKQGKLVCLAGDLGSVGAAQLAAMAALKSGVGMVKIATPQPAMEAMHTHGAEIMVSSIGERFEVDRWNTMITWAHALVIGPGFSQHPQANQTLRTWVENSVRQREKASSTREKNSSTREKNLSTGEKSTSSHTVYHHPIVLDAQALNACVGLSLHESMIITPHAAEAGRWLQCSAAYVEQNRAWAAYTLAQQSKAIVVLKGAGTWVVHPSGKAMICPWGNPGMATAGMGDVLSGIIGAYLARGMTPWQAACVGVAVHSQAGDLAAHAIGIHALIASDVISHIGMVLRDT